MTIAIAGCASEETTVVTTSPSPSPAASPAPSPAVTAPTATQPQTAQRPGLPAPVPGLIQSTNPQERGRQVETEIRTNQGNNPFAPLPPVIPNPDGGTRPVPTVAQLPGTNPGPTARTPSQPTAAAPTPRTGQPGTTGRPGTTGGGQGVPSIPEIAAPSVPRPQQGPLGFNLPPVNPQTGTTAAGIPLPPPPSTDTAEAVAVTGVVTVGGSTQAIVVAPGEPTSRYVGVGQRIAGGKVLVKRVEYREGLDPIVILEENGVEVSKAVGETPQTDRPAA